MVTFRLAATGLLLAITPALLADTYPRQTDIDAVHYAFRLELSDDKDSIEGEARVDIRFLRDDVREFWLDLKSLANGKGMTVASVTAADKPDQPVSFEHKGDRLWIRFPATGANELRRFAIRYSGVPAAGLRIGPNQHGERTFFGMNWPDEARHWLPMIDHPWDKATSEFELVAPAKYQAVANGLLVEETDLAGGRRLTHWKQSVPISSWLNAIGVARFSVRRFAVSRGIELSTWVFPQERAKGILTFETPAARAIEFFSEKIGPYPYEKLANVEAAGLNGGVEHASVILYSEKAVTEKPATSLVAHEIAHQWFGDSVTERDWDDVWLSEGFATYFALLYTEHYEGRDQFVVRLRQSRDQVFAIERKMPQAAVRHQNLADMSKVLNGLVYQKGGWTLHMLRGVVGTEAFWAGIREYYKRFRDANASTAEFRQVMERASGQKLDWFFDQWLNRPGSPALTGTWTYNGTAKRVEIELEQTQVGAAYRLPLEVEVTPKNGLGSFVQKLDMTAKRQHFEIVAENEPEHVVLDPGTWVLLSAKLRRRP